MFADPSNVRLQNNAVFYKEILAENEMKGIITPVVLQNARPADDYRASEDFVSYERLCRGEETIVSKLFFFSSVACYVVHCKCAVLSSELKPIGL